MNNPVWIRLQLLFSRGVALLIGHEKVPARVLADEILPNIDRGEPYGFSYRPKPGAQTYLLFPCGDRSRGAAIVIGDKRFQMYLEVSIHAPAMGATQRPVARPPPAAVSIHAPAMGATASV